MKDEEVQSLYGIVLQINRSNVGGIREAGICQLKDIVLAKQHFLKRRKKHKHPVYVMNVIEAQINYSQLLVRVKYLRVYLNDIIVTHVELLEVTYGVEARFRYRLDIIIVQI